MILIIMINVWSDVLFLFNKWILYKNHDWKLNYKFYYNYFNKVNLRTKKLYDNNLNKFKHKILSYSF